MPHDPFLDPMPDRPGCAPVPAGIVAVLVVVAWCAGSFGIGIVITVLLAVALVGVAVAGLVAADREKVAEWALMAEREATARALDGDR